MSPQNDSVSDKERLSSLEKGQAFLIKDLDNLTRQVSRLVEVMQQGQKTQWGPILAAVALSVTIAGMGLSYINKIEEQTRFSMVRLYDYHHSQEKDIRGLLDRVSAIEERKKRRD